MGDGSKIGSNAVVLQDIPKNTTVVGIPARTANKYSGQIIENNNENSDFRPYGQIPGLSDPIDETISSLLTKIEFLEKELLDIKSMHEK